MVWYKFKTFYSGCFIVCLHLFIFWGYFIVPCGKFGSPFIWITYNSRRKCCRFLSASTVFSCVHIIVWLPVFVIFNARTYADVCDCARGLYEHRKKVYTESTLRASLSGTFLQTLPDLVTPLKGHSLSPCSCPPTRSAPSERFGYW